MAAGKYSILFAALIIAVCWTSAVVTCITAALYMVLFKLIFVQGCDWQTFFTYFMVKGMAVAVFGGLGLLFLPSSQLGLPTGSKGWYYLSINMITNICFNLSLAWGMLVVSPLACRLFVLLGLPLSLLLDSALGIAIVFQRVLGVFLVTLGVAGFEASTGAKKSGERSAGDLEIENVSDARDQAEAECITSPAELADVEVSDESTSQSQETGTCASSSSSQDAGPQKGPGAVSSSILCMLATSICLGGFIAASVGR